MRISYKKLWLLLLERDISKATLRTDLKLATGTMAKLNKGEEVALSVLMRTCQYLRLHGWKHKYLRRNCRNYI